MQTIKVYMEVQVFDAPKVIGPKKRSYVGRVAKKAFWNTAKQAMVESDFVTLYNEDGSKFGDIVQGFPLVFEPKAAKVGASTTGVVEAEVI